MEGEVKIAKGWGFQRENRLYFVFFPCHKYYTEAVTEKGLRGVFEKQKTHERRTDTYIYTLKASRVSCFIRGGRGHDVAIVMIYTGENRVFLQKSEGERQIYAASGGFI